MESSPLQSSVPYYLMDPSQIPTDPKRNVFASIEQAFSDCQVINFSLRRTGSCRVDYEFKFFSNENLSLESVILEGKANVNYGCLLSSPLIPNVNIELRKPGEQDFGKVYLMSPGSLSAAFLGSQYEGRTQFYTKCGCCCFANMLDKNEKPIYTSELFGCNFNCKECIQQSCCLSHMYDIRLATMYSADESRQPAFSVWKKKNCGACCICDDAVGCCAGCCIKIHSGTAYYKIEKIGTIPPERMIYVMLAALNLAMATRI